MSHIEQPSIDESKPEQQQASLEQGELIDDESLVEEVSIDGMCGVY